MRFRAFDSLRVFEVVARHRNFGAAAAVLHLSKGAVSYQIARLEEELGFAVFDRQPRGVVLTSRGAALLEASRPAFADLERRIDGLRGDGGPRITIGMATYFAARWLSPRLGDFLAGHPGTALRLQPLIDLVDLRAAGIDMAIRWGRGAWNDMAIEPLLPRPAFVTGGVAIAQRVREEGLAAVLADVTLLHDRDASPAWRDWHKAAGLPLGAARDGLVIPDPNVRVQAVIDGQGVALNDALVGAELAAGTLVRLSPVALEDYGYYLAYPEGALETPGLATFRDWILDQARKDAA